MRSLLAILLSTCAGCAGQTWAKDPANLPPPPCVLPSQSSPRLVIRRAYRADRHAAATMSFVTVNGATVFQSSEAPKLEQRLVTLYDRQLLPGIYQVRATERVKGMYRYQPGTVDLPVGIDVELKSAGSACITYTVYSGGDPASSHPSLPSIRLDVAPSPARL